MSKALDLSYFYGTEAEQYAFYRIPKILFTDTRFRDLSVDAKVLYGLMLDRMQLSMKNGWLDGDNKVFIYFTLEDAMEFLGYGHSKVIKLLSELDTTKGIGLIERKKQGQGKPTIIYVKSFASIGADQNKAPVADRKTYSKPNFKTSEKQKSETESDCADTENIPQDIDFEVPTPQNILFMPSDNEDAEVLTSEKQKSAPLQNRSLDFPKTDTNNTYSSNTDFSNTHSIYPSLSPYDKKKSEQTENDGLMDRISNEDLEEMVLEELYHQKTLPYEYTADERKMTIAIREFTEYEHYESCALANQGCDFHFSALKVFCEALVEMLTTKEVMKLKGSYVTYAKVYDKLLEYLKFNDGTLGTFGTIYDLQETAINDFTGACKENTIKNHLAYMKSCIWNAMQVGDMGMQALIKRDFG